MTRPSVGLFLDSRAAAGRAGRLRRCTASRLQNSESITQQCGRGAVGQQNRFVFSVITTNISSSSTITAQLNIIFLTKQLSGL